MGGGHMYQDGLYCEFTSGLYLSPERASTLLRTAVQMIQGRLREKDMTSLTLVGKVTTEFKTKALGDHFGIEFTADVFTELGQGRVVFIARDPGPGIHDGMWLFDVVKLPGHGRARMPSLYSYN